MNATFQILAQDAAPNPLQSFLGSGFIFPLAMIILFYFMLIRPQQQQKKEHAKKVAALKKGDEIITNGGIHGVINHKSEKTCSVRIAEGIFIKMELANISSVVPKGSAKPEEKTEKPA